MNRALAIACVLLVGCGGEPFTLIDAPEALRIEAGAEDDAGDVDASADARELEADAGAVDASTDRAADASTHDAQGGEASVDASGDPCAMRLPRQDVDCTSGGVAYVCRVAELQCYVSNVTWCCR